MQKTNISWTDYSWNPTVGCENNCPYCYARKVHNMRHKAYLAGKKLPIQYAKPFNEIQLFSDRLNDPLHKRKPCKIFVGSVADLFSPSVPFEFIDKVHAAMVEPEFFRTHHTYQVLTKRPDRAIRYYSAKGRLRAIRKILEKNYEIEMGFKGMRWPFPNIWLGVSVENQKTADEQIPILLQIPAAVRWVSFEPLLGPVELRCIIGDPRRRCVYDCLRGTVATEAGVVEDKVCGKLGWGVVGCESGPKRRPCKLEWVRHIVEQFKAAGHPVFVKQLDIGGKLVKDIEKFPPDLRIQDYPE